MTHFETDAIRTQIEQTAQHEHSTPLYLTSSFLFDDAEHMRALFADEQDGLIYSRFTNPNTTELIDKMCLLEGAEAGVATATGMAAVFASIMGLLVSGDHIVASRALFGSTHTLLTTYLPRWGITTTMVDGTDLDAWRNAITPATKMFIVESPSNPALDVLDITSICAIAHEHRRLTLEPGERDIIVMVDNCFATPYLQTPVALGADIVVHSATKYLDGQGRVLGGLVLGKKDFVRQIYLFCRNSGPSMSPFNAWILSKSLETLAVRMDRHCSNALAVAQYLEAHTKVEYVRYPHLPSHPQYTIAKTQMRQGGGLVAFVLKGGLDAGRRFLDARSMSSLSANLGDTRTIITHPASTTHAKVPEDIRVASGIYPGSVRISVGLEHIDDILADLEGMLGAA
ncbi:MAG: aminotransferase class I/II-fold pyridoxal phosphate-dependent enzyme [bacterium]|nr:aminotransferase class I/II-fold pyridoxal phosphate-dependent enzyme [bacterium]